MDRMQRSRNFNPEEEEVACTKIYYASRTHSQLTQVLPELSKIKLKQPVSIANYHTPVVSGKRPLEDEEELSDKQFRTVSLGSRKQLCINDDLKARARDLDEACRELLGGERSITKSLQFLMLVETEKKRCQFLPPPGEEVAMLDFRDQVLALPKDIEDLAEAGRASHICPYFGSRKAIPQAEVRSSSQNFEYLHKADADQAGDPPV